MTVLHLVPAAFFGSELGMRFTMVAIGVATVALIAVLARELAGDLVGIVAGAIAAVNPNLWANDGLLMSETPGTFLAAALLLLLYRILRRGPTKGLLVTTGIVVGLGILTRAEFMLLVPLLVVPVLVIAARPSWSAVVRALALTGAMALVLVGPWVAFNMARFEKTTFVSTNDGLSLRAANCPMTYHGELFGWVGVFPPCALYEPFVEQSVMSARNRELAIRYIRSNLGRYPIVVAARLGRTWGVFRPSQSMSLGSHEGRPLWVSWLSLTSSWLWLPFAVVGGRAVRRRGERIWPLVALVLVVNAVLALWAGGLLRYRSSAEPAMVVLVAVGLVALTRRKALVQCPT
jgi:4-amino-4-deoxy-L-arabinose transferase-like glycosyltransferase